MSKGVSVFYSDGNKHEKGVRLLLSQEVANAMISQNPVNNRIFIMCP
jgi:hypothetical protein